LVLIAAIAALFIEACGGSADRLHDAVREETAGASQTNGKIAFEMSGDIYSINPDGTGVKNLTETKEMSESDPAWSPDGRRIAFIACRECTTSDVFVMDAHGNRVRRITTDAPLDGKPAWSPDGTKIAFHSDASGYWSEEDGGYVPGNEDIWMVDAQGTNRLPITNSPDRELGPSWSPNGTRIAFTSIRGTDRSSIHVINVDGSSRTQLTDPTLWSGSAFWSPDGSTLAFDVIDLSTTTPDVFVMDEDGSDVRQLTEEPTASVRAWSPDGSMILFAKAGLHTLDLDSGAVEDLYLAPKTERNGAYIHGVAWQGVPPTAGES
jgi:TolB protein